MITKIEQDNPAPNPSQFQDQHLSFITNYTEVTEEKGDTSRLPLVRLRVDYTGFPKIRASQFGNAFRDKVANPDDILLLKKNTEIKKKSGKNKKNGGEDEKDEEKDGTQRQMRGGNLFNLAAGPQKVTPIEDIIINNITSENSAKLTVFPELDLLHAVQDFVDKEDNKLIEQYCDDRLEELELSLISSKCMADTSEIEKNASKLTAVRRQELLIEREHELLEKEQKEEEKRQAGLMDIDEVKDVAKNGPSVAKQQPQSQSQSNDNDTDNAHNHNHNRINKNVIRKSMSNNTGNNRNRNHNHNRNVKEEQKDNDDDFGDSLMDGFEELTFPKKKKANLKSIGTGAASQSMRESIISNSQQNDTFDPHPNDVNDDDIDLQGLSDMVPTPSVVIKSQSRSQFKSSQSQQKSQQNRNKNKNRNKHEPPSKRRKLGKYDIDDDDENHNKNSKGNDVLSLLGMDDDDDEDQDVDMENNNNSNQRIKTPEPEYSPVRASELLSDKPVRRSQIGMQTQLVNANARGTLDHFIVSSIPKKNERILPNMIDTDNEDDKKNIIASNNNSNDKQEMDNSQSQSSQKLSGGRGRRQSQKKKAFGGLLKKRGQSQRQR